MYLINPWIYRQKLQETCLWLKQAICTGTICNTKYEKFEIMIFESSGIGAKMTHNFEKYYKL